MAPGVGLGSDTGRAVAAVPAVGAPGGGSRRGGPAQVVGDLPDRVLLVLLWTGLVVAVAVVAGQFRPVVVGPAALAVVALTWRWRPAPPRRSRSDALAAAACLLLLVAWVALQVPLTGERFLVTRDPDVYTLTATWLVDHPSPGIPVPPGGQGTLGFDLQDGHWRPQGSHLVPALSAAVGWLAGGPGVLASGLVWGAAGLLGTYALGRRVLGAWWALVPAAALGLSLPVLDTSRSLYTEPVALALTMLGCGLLLDAWRSGRLRDVALAGLALGAVSVARVDGLVAVLGPVAGLTPLAMASAAPSRGLRFGSAVLAAAAAPPVLLGVADLATQTGGYWEDLRRNLGALAVVGVLAALGATLPAVVSDARVQRWRRRLPRLAPVAALLLVAVLGLLASRPWWSVSRGDRPNDVVAAAQAAEGLPLDATRSYDELALTWLTWYWGVPAVALGLLGWVLWLYLGLRRPEHRALVVLLLVGLPSGLLYLWSPAITPDQVWAVRRFLPAAVPLVLVAATWTVSAPAAAVRRGRLLRVPAVALAAVLVAQPASTLPGLWSVRDRAGLLAGVEQVCEAVRGRAAVVTGVDTLAPAVRVVCGVPTLALAVPVLTPARLLAARRALGGGEVAVVTRDPAGLPWRGDVRPRAIDIVVRHWEATLTRRPAGAGSTGTVVLVAGMDRQGWVVPEG